MPYLTTSETDTGMERTEVLLRNQLLLCRVQNSRRLATYVLPFDFLTVLEECTF